MKRRSRDINVFSISMLDVIAGALGVFVLISVILLPHYQKSVPEDYAACVVSTDKVLMAFFDFRQIDGDVIRVLFNDKQQGAPFELQTEGDPRWVSLRPGLNDLVIESVSDGDIGPNTGLVLIKPCRSRKESMMGWMISQSEQKKFAIIRK